MKRIAIYSTLALLLGAAIFRLLQHDSGYVLIAIAGKTIEMRFWFALLFVAAVSGFVIYFFSLLLKSIRLVSGGWSLALASRARRGAKQTMSGLVHYIEGDWLGAQKILLKAAKDVDEPLVHYLAAARSAYETGDFKKAQTLIEKAQKLGSDNNLAIAISQARMFFLSENFEGCLTVLHGVKGAEPSHPVILSLLQKAYLAIEDWASLEALLPLLVKKNILSELELAGLQKTVYCNLLNAADQKRDAKLLVSESEQSLSDHKQANVQGAASHVDQVWLRIPKALQANTELVYVYARILLRAKRFDETEVLLRTTLKKQWSDSLVELYGLVLSHDLKLQLRTAELWLTLQKDNAVLHLTLGRICLLNELWGQAKDYFQSSLNLRAAPTTYAELARLQSALGDHEQSNLNCQQGLLSATNGLPDLPLPSV